MKKQILKPTQKKTIRSRRVQRLKQFRETGICHCVPDLPVRDYLEMKHGELCLRRNDDVSSIGGGKFRIEKSWLRPGKIPFDRNIYRINQ